MNSGRREATSETSVMKQHGLGRPAKALEKFLERMRLRAQANECRPSEAMDNTSVVNGIRIWPIDRGRCATPVSEIAYS